MKKLFTYGFAAALAMLVNAEPSFAYNQVRLTFSRTGTTVSTVSVNVTDETGAAIDGVTASLLSVKQGTGIDASASATDVGLKNGAQLNTHPEILCAAYANSTNTFEEFTFKITGLSGFTFNHSDLQLAALNGSANFQNTYPRNFDVRVWADESKTTSIASQDGVDVCTNVSKATTSGVATGTALYSYDNTNDWELKNTTTTTATDEQTIVVRVMKSTGNQGCFCGLKQITLYNGYRFGTTSTSNLGYVATFSASNNVVFDTNTTAYIATNVEGDNSKVKLFPINGALTATKGAIVSKATEGDAYAYIDATATADTRTNLLVGGGDEAKDLTTSSYYIFNKQGEEAVFSPLSADGSLAANKAALQYSTPHAQPLSITLGDATGIKTVTEWQSGASNGLTYDISGRQVSAKKLPAGIYVKNGKKVIVK